MHMFIFEKQKSDKLTMSAMFVNMSDCTVTGQPEGHAVTRYHTFTVNLQISVSFTFITSRMHDQHSRVLIRRLSASGSERAHTNKACFTCHTLQTQWAHKPEVQLHELSSSSREETRCKD